MLHGENVKRRTAYADLILDDGKRGSHGVQQLRKTLAQNALCFQLTQRHALGRVRLIRIKSEVLQIQQRRLVIRHGHAVRLDFERQVSVAHFKAQPAHLLHGGNARFDQP